LATDRQAITLVAAIAIAAGILDRVAAGAAPQLNLKLIW
jgi:hypothetical protein